LGSKPYRMAWSMACEPIGEWLAQFAGRPLFPKL
jgi:hypothetical protein